MNRTAIYILGIMVVVVGWVATAYSQEYVLVGWNDLGMHCSNKDFSKIGVLPPYNTIHAQLIVKQTGQPPHIVTSGFTVEYSIPNNTYSVGKTNFWDYAQQLFGLSSPLPANIGLTGKGLTGTLDTSGNNFVAVGIPLTPYSDTDLVNETPFQLIHLVAKETASGNIVATTDAVIPVSNEIGCVQSGCHASEFELLSGHPLVTGFNPGAGPILCASCHASNALGTTGQPEAGIFSERIHGQHVSVAGPPNSISTCYKCHPGPQTQCLRDIMGKNPTNPLICQNCHGTLDTLAATIAAGRRPWLDEPKCGHCHGATFSEETGKLYRMSTGHGGLFCEACHGSPHAIQPTVQPNDNYQNIRLQGFAGALRKCGVCHTVPPSSPGPHGLVDTTHTAPLAPVLRSPADGISNQPLTVVFQWESYTGAGTYRLEVATDSAYTSIIFNDSSIVTEKMTVSALQFGTTYFWHVNAKNSNGTSNWSTSRTFTTVDQIHVPLLVFPANGAIRQATTLRARWNSVIAAESYRIQISTDSLLVSGILIDSTGTDTLRMLNGLPAHTPLFWHVRAIGYGDTSAWSPPWNFITGDTSLSIEVRVGTGWNLVSLPVDVLDHCSCTLYPSARSAAFGYEGKYVSHDSLMCGFGYWVKFAADTTTEIIGSSLGHDTINLHHGWNIIGSIDQAVPVGSIVSIPPGMITSHFYHYNYFYQSADTLKPGSGYWVKVTQPGSIILAPPTVSVSARNGIIRISDDSEMPPPPPGQGTIPATPAPAEYRLVQAYPNPFNPITKIRYQLPSASKIHLTIFNLLGQMVVSLVDGEQPAGYHTASWNAVGCGSGIYFYKLEAISVADPGISYRSVKKLLLVK